MLRREAGDWWVIISQVEHARLARLLAEGWSGGPEPGTADEWLWSVEHHDDGWREWEKSPDLNESGEPRAFDEMRMQVSTGIWDQSIETCGGHSPWSGLWVSRHFCFLGERALAHHGPQSDAGMAIERFLAVQQNTQKCFRDLLRKDFAPEEIGAREEWGYRHLQFFDRLSLWVCLSQAGNEQVWELPGEKEVRLQRIGEEKIEISRGFLREELILSVAGRRVRRVAGLDEAGWRQGWEGAEGVQMRWRVAPGP